MRQWRAPSACAEQSCPVGTERRRRPHWLYDHESQGASIQIINCPELVIVGMNQITVHPVFQEIANEKSFAQWPGTVSKPFGSSRLAMPTSGRRELRAW